MLKNIYFLGLFQMFYFKEMGGFSFRYWVFPQGSAVGEGMGEPHAMPTSSHMPQHLSTTRMQMPQPAR